MSSPNTPMQYEQKTPTWRIVLNVSILAGVLIALFFLGQDLNSRMKGKSFAILYPENAALNTLLGFIAIVGLVFLTSYIGKMIGQSTRKHGKVSYLSVLNDQLTHVFFWFVILFSLYPIFYVISASFDPLNRLTQATLGTSEEPLLIRSRVLPSLEGLSFANYAKLFEGVNIFSWQWLLLGVSAIGVLGIAVIWAIVQRSAGGLADPKITRARVISTWIAILGVFAFFGSLSIDQFTGFSNSSKFLLWIRNTFLVSGMTGILTVLLCTTTGYGLARLRFPGRFEFLMFLIFIQMFPALLGLVAMYELIYRLGLTESLPGLVIAYTGGAVSFGTWIYKGYVESLPASLEEAALVDGCTRWTAFTKIVLPLSGPMMVFIFLMQFVGTYTEFLTANVLVTGAQNWNVGVGLRSFATGQFSVEYGTFAAAAVLGAIPIVLLYYSFQQVFVSGNTAGGEKG
jgi:arabinogalactan oligomer / maltooligosaccharide transport system permease protein